MFMFEFINFLAKNIFTCRSGVPGGCGTAGIYWETNEESGGVYDVTTLRFYSSGRCKLMEAYILTQTNYEENYNKYLFYKPESTVGI